MKASALAFTFVLLLSGNIFGESPETKLSPDTSAAVKGNTAFAFELYAELAKKDGNLFFSPYSISNALAMTYAGARGETEKQMAKTLHFTLDQKRLHPAFHDLKKQLIDANEHRKYELHIANRLWGQKSFGFLPEFVTTTEKNYGAGLKEVDFIHNREAARAAINGWVEEQTKKRIKELFKPGILAPQTRLVLTNAIYFKAAWRIPFRAEQTKDGEFTLANGRKIKTKLIHDVQTYDYFKGDNFEVLELPYEEKELSMIVLLPSKADGLPAFEKSLTAANLAKRLGKLEPRQVELTFPTFKATSEFELGEALQKMGMPLAFGDRADFSGIATGGLFIAHVVHKAFVSVDEEGTEAAAATGVQLDQGAAQPARFCADRPFVYLIRENRTGSILFIGRLMNPS